MTHKAPIRLARSQDVSTINALIARSIRSLHAGIYSADLIEEAVEHAYGVDWQLVRDGTYYVSEIGDAIVGAGGWSFRKTIAGAHGPDDRPAPRLDPRTDAARIRAFYVEPAFARRWIGAVLLGQSEAAARQAHYAAAELTSTLQATSFYTACGYSRVEDYEMPLPSGVTLTLVLMRKLLS